MNYKSKTGQSRADEVQQRIRVGIRNGRYQPGARIREAEVAEWLGVSRTPVREALRRLEADGLVSFEPWRGVVVAELDRQAVGELYAMRGILEGAAARMAARYIDDAEIDLLELLLQQADEVAEDAEKLARINRRFHQTLSAAARNRYLLQSMNQQENGLALLNGTTFSVPGRAVTAAEEHRAIVEAIRARDPEAAERAARAHIANAQHARLRLILEEEQE
ncbi:MAG: GntR family transcriptional regulator [Pseudomonadota bacterium]